MITRQEIETALEECEDFNRYHPDDCSFDDFEHSDLKFEEIESGGEMNDTNCQYVVVKVSRIKDPEVFKHIKFEGYYNSWEGTEWDGLMSIVEPQIVQKTIWNKLEE